MIYTCKPSRVELYINTAKKTAAQIKAETGCTAVINGGLYNMSTFEPVCHLKADGRVLASDQYGYWGIGWNTAADLALTVKYEAYKNYICCVCMVRDGKADQLIYPSGMGGARPRTAFGLFADGRVWLYADTANPVTPEQLQRIALEAGVTHAVMMDGGGSTQGISPAGVVSSTRKVHNFICVWAEEEKTEGVRAVFKIALGAGHGINTAGKRCLKSLDPNETPEWWLNDRVCDYVESYLKEYEGYDLLRVDDSDDGKDDVALSTRVQKVNNFGADFYLSVHHNAGINGGIGGGIIAVSCPGAGAVTVAWRGAMYNALIKHTGLRGNRSDPTPETAYYVLKYSKMPAVLVELGFMDSKTDVPVILTDAYAQKCAKAIVEVLATKGKLTKKAQQPTGARYKVQVGAFANKANAEKLKAELTAKGYQAYITQA